MADDDKYPASSGRRRFVKGVVGSAALAGIGTSTNAMVNTMTARQGAGGGITEYYGMELVSGPAPRGMPQIPVRIDDEGYLIGLWPEVQEITQEGLTVTIAQQELADITYSSEWFQYCGIQTYPGIQPNADQDNYFRYASGAPYQWQQDEVEAGERAHIDHFDDFRDWGNAIGDEGIGKPASVTWRSQDLPPQETIPVQIIRSENVIEAAQNDEWLQASTREGFIANMNKCTHFCCVPGFKSFQDSAQFGAENLIYCQCHQSVYDPFSIIRRSFVALPREGD